MLSVFHVNNMERTLTWKQDVRVHARFRVSIHSASCMNRNRLGGTTSRVNKNTKWYVLASTINTSQDLKPTHRSLSQITNPKDMSDAGLEPQKNERYIICSFCKSRNEAIWGNIFQTLKFVLEYFSQM